MNRRSIILVQAFHIVDKKPNKPVWICWTFPDLPKEHRDIINKKVFTLEEKNAFNCIRCSRDNWLYIREFENGPKQMAVCLLTTDYDPYKYELLCNILFKTFQKNGNYVELVKMYLSVYTEGKLSVQENGTSITHHFKCFSTTTNVKEMIKAFGLEIILIYNALLLKKRMLVYHPNMRKLLKALFSISQIMLYRHTNDYLYPHIDDMLDARREIFFMAGTTNSKPPSKHYDLFIDLSSLQISITSHAKKTFAMNKTHKDLATFMVQLAEKPENTEQQIIQAISTKTEELLINLKSLATVKTSENKSVITMEALRAKNFDSVTENFLFNLAWAENIMML